jgi:hypothetical protein
MLTALLIGLGWIATACVVAKLVARFIAAGAQRERTLPEKPQERIAWIRGEEPSCGESTSTDAAGDDPRVTRPPKSDWFSQAKGRAARRM